MKKLTIFKLPLLLLALLPPNVIFASELCPDFDVDGIFYKHISYYNHGSTSHEVVVWTDGLCGDSQYEGHVTIPSTVTYDGITYTVTGIGYDAFAGDGGLTGVTIPNTVTFFDFDAFAFCTGLTSIEIPNSVTDLGYGAFEGCTGLTSISIPNSVTYLGPYALAGCSGLTSIDLPNTVTGIGECAFMGCSGLTSIDLSNSVTYIGEYAFKDCSSLSSISFSNSLRYIELNAFEGTPWYANQPNGVVYAGLMAYKYKGIMPDDTRITIKNGTRVINYSAFSGFSGLTGVTFPNSLTNIGYYAFQGCTGLTSITFPSSLTFIGDYAFNDCALDTIKCLSTVPPVMASRNCFSGMTFYNATLLVPHSSIEAYKTADDWCYFAHIQGFEDANMGDVNGDGEVNISDINMVINAIISGNYSVGDVNGDGEVNISDITYIIDCMLSQ